MEWSARRYRKFVKRRKRGRVVAASVELCNLKEKQIEKNFFNLQNVFFFFKIQFFEKLFFTGPPRFLRLLPGSFPIFFRIWSRRKPQWRRANERIFFIFKIFNRCNFFCSMKAFFSFQKLFHQIFIFVFFCKVLLPRETNVFKNRGSSYSKAVVRAERLLAEDLEQPLSIRKPTHLVRRMSCPVDSLTSPLAIATRGPSWDFFWLILLITIAIVTFLKDSLRNFFV